MQLDLTMIISDGSEFRVNAGSAEQGWQSRGGGGGGRHDLAPLPVRPNLCQNSQIILLVFKRVFRK